MRQPMEKRKMVKFLKAFFATKDTKTMIEEYLADSISLEDLERRQRMIERNQAPWQIQASQNLRGWL